MSAVSARILMLAAAVLFSTGGAGIKVAAFDAAQVSALRSGIAALALLAFARGRVAWSPIVVAASAAYAGVLTLFVASTKLTTAANAIFLQATAPLYLLVLAPLVLRERFHRRDLWYLAAVAAGMIGCFVGQPEGQATAPNPPLGNFLGALSGLAWAITLLLLRYLGREAQAASGAVSAVVIGNAFAALGALPFAWPLPAASAGEWGTLVYLGVFQIGLAYVCLTAAIRHVPALEASLLLLLEPVLNPVWTWIVRGEDPGGWTIAGGALIVAATGLKAAVDTREARASVPPLAGP